MKKLILATALLMILTSLIMMAGCVRVNMSEKNGPLTTHSYDFTGFIGVDVGSALNVDVTYGASYNVTVTAGEKLFDKVKVLQVGNNLVVNIEGWSFNWWWGRGAPKISITTPELTYVHLSGASSGTISGFSSNNSLTAALTGSSDLNMDMETGFFTADLSGASSIKGRLVAAGSDIRLSGSSDISLTGSGGDVKLYLSGASDAPLLKFMVGNADVNFSGSSDGSLDVRGRLDVKLSGASDFTYAGNPTLGNQHVSGASELKEK